MNKLKDIYYDKLLDLLYDDLDLDDGVIVDKLINTKKLDSFCEDLVDEIGWFLK